jgi:hypothetical protein
MLRTPIAFISLLLCLSPISCDLFDTRTAADPAQKSSTFEPLTEPDLVLQNMINSFQDGNAVNYAKSFSDESFTFEASINARNVYGTQLTSWDKSKEQKYFEDVQGKLQKNSAATLTFSQTSSTISSDICDITTLYRLNVPHTVSGVVTLFRGQAQFQLVRDSKTGGWSMQKWIDSDIGSTASDSTWSYLKGAFSN